MGGVEHDQASELARGGRGDDLAPEAALDQQRHTPAVIEMGMGQQQEIDRLGLEAEGRGVLLLPLAAALIETAVGQDAGAEHLDEMAGAGDAARCAVKR
jgi:hypothetical protein